MDEQDKESIFRKSALEVLSTPDRLDQLITLTNPSRWAALIAIVGLIVMVTLWGIFGTIPQRVVGTTILVKNGGIVNVTPNTNGQVIDISVENGDTVHAGQVLARIDQSELQGQIFLLREQHDALIGKTATLAAMINQTENGLTIMRDQVNELLKAERSLQQSGIVTKAAVIDTEQKVTTLVGQLNQLTIQRIDAQQALDDTNRKLLALMQQYLYRSTVLAPTSGRIIEVKINQGDFVDPKTPMVSIEPTNQDREYLQAYIFVPVQDGKRIKTGMTVNITPSTVKREEYGTMTGTVTHVSSYPITPEAIMKSFQNESLVKFILSQGAVFEITATLTPDPSTYSGYKWSSPGGPPVEIQSGTIGEAQITYKRVHPITLILPIVQRHINKAEQQ